MSRRGGRDVDGVTASGSSPDLICQLDSIQGMVDALACVRWKRHQDAVIELSEHGMVVIVEDSGCLQAKVYLKRELFLVYEYSAEGRPRFGLSLGLFIDCLNTFSAPGNTPGLEIQYPGPDMQLMFKSVESQDNCMYAEIRTRIPDTISWDYHFDPASDNPCSFTIKTSVLKEAIDDLEWPGSAVQLLLQTDPPSVTFKCEGLGDLQIEFLYTNTDILLAFQCNRPVSYRYKYKFLRATTAHQPLSVLKSNRGSKFTVGIGGLLKIQHLVSVARQGSSGSHSADPSSHHHLSRIAYIEFYVRPDEDDSTINDA